MAIKIRKNRWQQIIHSKFVLVTLVVIAIGLSFSVYNRYQIQREINQRLLDSQAEELKLSERQAELKDKVDYLSEERGVEAEIRKHFDVAKEGEQVVVLLEDEKPTNTEITVNEEVNGKWWWPW